MFMHDYLLHCQHILRHKNGRICALPCRLQSTNEGTKPAVDQKLDYFGSGFLKYFFLYIVIKPFLGHIPIGILLLFSIVHCTLLLC
jgi:hypothetical protein